MTGDEARVLREPAETDGPRLLLLAPTFPPSAAAGALRWEAFAASLHHAGLALDVLTVDPVDADGGVDLSRLATLPVSTRVIAVHSVSTPLMRVGRAIVRGRAHLRRSSADIDGTIRNRAAGAAPGITRVERLGAFPMSMTAWRRAVLARLYRETEVGWGLAAQLAARQLTSRRSYLAVISSGPPNEAHVYARRIAVEAGIPFVMDMRDPWGTAVAVESWRASIFEHRHAEAEERACIAAAGLVLANTEVAAERLRAHYPAFRERIHVVRNGTQGPVHQPLPGRELFRIVFAGSVYLDRNPRLVFQAVRRLITLRQLSPAQIAVDFIGDSGDAHGTSISMIAREEQIAEYVHARPLLPRADLLQELRHASVLLSLNQDIETSIPAKIFEYMMFPAWLLVLARPGTATAQLMQEIGLEAFAPDDVTGVANALGTWYDGFRRGELPRAAGADGACSRDREATRLLALLRQVPAIRAAMRDGATAPLPIGHDTISR